jgi:hypothetical protein
MSMPMMSLASSATFSDDQYRYPVDTPIYQYLVCDLLTDQLQVTPPLSGVQFDRRLSRTGSFKGQWKVSNRQQALQADSVTKNGGRYALWVLRNKRLWWGGILWSAKGSISTRSYDVIDIQAATFDSYLDHRYLDATWPISGVDLTSRVVNIWNYVQGFAGSNIGMLTNGPIANLAGNTPKQDYLISDQQTYSSVIKAATDQDPGVDYTIDVFRDSAGARTKRVRVAGSFRDVEVINRMSVSGYRIPSWAFSRDATKTGTVFTAWGDPQEGNVGTAQVPIAGNQARAQELLDAGWPRLDVIENIGPVSSNPGQAVTDLTEYAISMRDRLKGIRDIVSYDVDLSTSEWHPNLIGQNIVMRHSQRDLWRPNERSVITPVVATFTPPDRGQPERVAFTIDGGEEDAA